MYRYVIWKDGEYLKEFDNEADCFRYLLDNDYHDGYHDQLDRFVVKVSKVFGELKLLTAKNWLHEKMGENE